MSQAVQTIDGSRIHNLESFFDEVETSLLPAGKKWGRNLDAFNDILNGGFGIPDGNFRLIWQHSEQSRAALGFSETVRQLQQRLRRCHESNRENIQRQLANAQASEGATVFDWLVEIIREHKNIELVLA